MKQIYIIPNTIAETPPPSSVLLPGYRSPGPAPPGFPSPSPAPPMPANVSLASGLRLSERGKERSKGRLLLPSSSSPVSRACSCACATAQRGGRRGWGREESRMQPEPSTLKARLRL
eukprot:1027753-Rhodomonas_salina.2